jgi:hypothetical protein
LPKGSGGEKPHKEKENIEQKGSLVHNSSARYDKLKAVTFKNRELFHKSAQRMKSQIRQIVLGEHEVPEE